MLPYTIHGRFNNSSFANFSIFSTTEEVATTTTLPTTTESFTTTTIRTIYLCDNTTDCSLTCSGYRECQYYILMCPHPPDTNINKYDCSITCSGIESCSNMLIIATYCESVSLSCANVSACLNMEILAPIPRYH